MDRKLVKSGQFRCHSITNIILSDFIPNKRLARISIFVRNKKYVLILLLDFSLEIGLFATRMNQTKLQPADQPRLWPTQTQACQDRTIFFTDFYTVTSHNYGVLSSMAHIPILNCHQSEKRFVADLYENHDRLNVNKNRLK